jgi:hypothetical protein
MVSLISHLVNYEKHGCESRLTYVTIGNDRSTEAFHINKKSKWLELERISFRRRKRMAPDEVAVTLSYCRHFGICRDVGAHGSAYLRIDIPAREA